MARANVPHVISDDSALGGQLVSGSLKFARVSNSEGTYLKRTPSVAGNRKKFALSVWVKRCGLGFWQRIFAATPDGGNVSGLAFRGDGNTDGIRLQMQYGSVNKHWTSTGKYRDTNAWYHIVLSVDLDASSGQRVILYVNGVRDVGSWVVGSEPDSSNQYGYNSVTEHQIGGSYGVQTVFDGYMTQFYWLDGISANATDFGYTESQTGIWRPKKYTGAFGTNGFYIPMDGTSHVGKDMSGNGNDYIPNKCGTVSIDKATGAFPIMNTNSGATIPRPGFRPDPFASNLVLAATFSDPIDTLDVHHLIKGSGSEKGLFVTGATKQTAIHNFYGRAGSLYFDGNADYINLSATTDFNFGTGDFTIEFWMYSGANSVDGGFYRRFWMTDGPTGNAVGNFQIAITPTTGVINLWEDGSGLNLLGVTNVTTSTWNHIAAVRSGSTLKLYVNGREDASTTYTTSIAPNSGTPRPRIGNYGAGGGEGDYNGYLQDLRVYKGVAKYTEEFLCGAVDPSITEHSPSGISVPRKLEPSTGGSTGFNMEGASVFFSSNSDLALNGDFTIEFWVYLESIQTDGGIHPSVITFPAESSQGIVGQVYINSANKFFGLYNSNSGDICRTPYKSATVGKWQYVTVTRSSNSCRIFIDGKLKQTGTDSTTYGNQLGIMRLGGYSRSNGMVDGHISNLRIIKGTALYTSDFTPPTEPLTNVSGTSLLCFQSPTDVEDVTVNSNSSTVNNQNWFKTGSYVNTEPASVRAVLDGDGYTFWGNGNAEATFTFPGSGIPFTKLEISGSNYNGHYVKVNGQTFTNWGSTFTNPPFHNVTSVGSPLTSITVKGSGGTTSTMSAIKINDTIMIAPDFANDPYSSDSASASNFSPFDTDTNLQGPSQYATLNANAHTGVTLTNGNLTNTGGNDIPSNMGVKTGKFYVEVSIETEYGSPNLKHLGVCATGTRHFRADSGNGHIINLLDTLTIRSDQNGPYTSTGRGGITSWTAVTDDTDVLFTLGDTVGIQLDMDNKFVKFFINGVLRNHYTFVPATTFDKMYFWGRNNGSGKTTWNFGQKPYEYTPPPGFLPLASHNLESPTVLRPQKHFESILYTPNSSGLTVTGLEFKPDFIWFKSRAQAYHHYLFDSLRGTGARSMRSSDTTPEPASSDATHVTEFLNNGFYIAGASGINDNGSGTNGVVAWCWKAGTPEISSGGSVGFDGANGTNLHIANNADIQIGSTSNWTIEFWLKRTAAYSDYDVILGKGTSGTYEWFVEGFADGSVKFLYTTDGNTTWAGTHTIISSQALDRWYHIAIVRNGSGANNFKTYVDGSQTFQTTAFDIYAGTANLDIGGYGGASAQDPPVEISNLRIVKGTSVYTSNFTPPTSPLTNITNTKLLCCQSIRSATEAAVSPGSITSNGGCAPTSTNPFHAFTKDGVAYSSVSAAGITDGNIPLTGVSVNTKLGFSIGTWGGTGSSGNIATGLSDAQIVILKNRTVNGTNWVVYHKLLDGSLDFLYLNNNNAGSDSSLPQALGSLFGVGTNNDTNGSGSRMSFYAFQSMPGISKLGFYKGSGDSNGAYVDVGFRPAFLMLKKVSSTGNWFMLDNKRDGYNETVKSVSANSNATETTDSNFVDFYANGFKLKTSGAAVNSGDILYMAFAEHPEVTPFGSQSNAR